MADTISENNNVREHDNMGTRYQISSTMMEQKNKWVRISFGALDDTTSPQNSQKKQKAVPQPPPNSHEKVLPDQKLKSDDSSCKTSLQEPTLQSIPESVLQYQRQLRKIRAADRASKTNVNIQDHLHTVYFDDHIAVTDKPSGILCVPGVNKHKSLLNLVFEVYGSENANDEESPSTAALPRDSMIVHRLDMDTSGIVIFARTRLAMSELHKSFRERTGTKKVYEALLVGWLDIDQWIESVDESGGREGDMEEVEETVDKSKPSEDVVSSDDTESLGGGEINLPLQRDHRHPPFMRVSTPESEAEARLAVKDLNHNGYKKLIAKKPKPSTTKFRILSHEKWMGHPVTRMELIPITGRTHQLRAHCAAMGHPILGDLAYGFFGEAHPNGGFSDEVMSKMSPTSAAFELRRDAEDTVRENGRTMCLHARQLTIKHPVTG
eukprot:CAMPEP_0201940294 /NCGR_PEP_ID=MMETSP0903-20130614/44943_1 /ASSEMBLY_ACC=CAM_ASM_000552 /TAXON_ID=420261 /ORGANISM="Thalassiosira antarctica, Strain CCMP982" /LENGTH=436 /DNA_ID=CAMNT_0048482055 /DNA_START=124 /DNA_END=1430 /DNA_ORIENTATION=-